MIRVPVFLEQKFAHGYSVTLRVYAPSLYVVKTAPF